MLPMSSNHSSYVTLLPQMPLQVSWQRPRRPHAKLVAYPLVRCVRFLRS